MKLSIAIVTMNRAEQLQNAIRSCLACKLPEKTEFVIVDNGSTDNTNNIIINIFSNCKYPCVYEKQAENIGAGAGRNRYFELSSGEYIYGMDDDAIIDYKNNPDFFIRGIKIMDEHSQIVALATQIYDVVWKANRLEVSGRSFADDLYYCKMFCEGSHFLRKAFFTDVPYLPNKYGYEGLLPSLKIWNEGYINAFCPSLLAIHQPKVNKWDYSKKENFDLLINEYAVLFAIKRMMYPNIFSILLVLALAIRVKKYAKHIPDFKEHLKNAIDDVTNNYPIDYKIKVSTVMKLYVQFGVSVF